MFEDNVTLKLNIVTFIVAAGFFGYVLLLAPGFEPAASVGATPDTPTMPASPRPARQHTGEPTAATITPSATPTLTPTYTSTLTPTRTLTATSTPRTVTLAASPTSVPEVRYVVAPGDVLSAIATQYGVTVEAIIAANELEDPDQLEIGQELIIPASAATPTP